MQKTSETSSAHMPNRNAYLAVCLDDTTLHALVEVQNILEKTLSQAGHGFDRMKPEELHMTFFFAAESLSRLKADMLAAWHRQVRVAVQDSGSHSDATMRLVGFDVFPPGKNNLVVARFEVPMWLRELQKRVEEEAHAAGLGVSDSHAKAIHGAWVPHVTLGKVRANRTQVVDAASRAAAHAWLVCGRGVDEGHGEFAPIHGLLDSLKMALADRLTLCGEQPKQLWIDWRETLRFVGQAGFAPRGGDEGEDIESPPPSSA